MPTIHQETAEAIKAAARNEWIRSTERLVTEAIDAMLAEQADDDQLAELGEEASL